MPFPSSVPLKGPRGPAETLDYLTLLKLNSSGRQVWPVTCSMAGVGLLWGSIDGVVRNYHTGLGAMRGALNLGATTLVILSLRDFVFAPAKLFIQHRAPTSFPLYISNLDPAESSPRLHNMPEMFLAGGLAGLALGRYTRRPHLLRAAFSLALGTSLFQYLGNELYLQQIRYIHYRDRQLLSHRPIVTFGQRVKDLGANLVDRFFGLGVATKIEDEEYLMDQEVQLEMLDAEREVLELELAKLEATYASLARES